MKTTNDQFRKYLERQALVEDLARPYRIEYYEALNANFQSKIIFDQSGSFAVWNYNGITINLLNNNVTEILINLYGMDFESMEQFVKNNNLNINVLDYNY